MGVLAFLVFFAQTSPVLPPPSPPAAHSEVVARSLREACLSEAGVAIAMKDWLEGQKAARARTQEDQKIERELGEAAYAVPIDIDRLERAAQAREANQAERLAEHRRRDIATLRRLSPRDRAFFARRFTPYRPVQAYRPCPRSAQ